MWPRQCICRVWKYWYCRTFYALLNSSKEQLAVYMQYALCMKTQSKAQVKSNTTCTRAQVLQFLRDLQFRRISSARAPWHTSHPSASESQMPQIIQCYEQWIRHVYPYTIILYTVQKQHGTLLIKLPQMPQIILVTPPALTNAKSAC